MVNEIIDKKELSFDSPEIQELFADVMARSEAIKKRQELSDYSFRVWICEVITAIANKMGYVVRNLIIEIPADLAYSFKKGFSAGIDKAKKNSYRYTDKTYNMR
ncbi:MAG: hypothetical protein IJF88_01590 [Oscillospiraceae bacterium]|nr:hypothetical protein [Oscillospiraceae bacterium]